jgi:hypothetical protein
MAATGNSEDINIDFLTFVIQRTLNQVMQVTTQKACMIKNSIYNVKGNIVPYSITFKQNHT